MAIYTDRQPSCREEFMYKEWVKCTDREPYLSDRSVLMHFANGSIETVHVEDFFKPITNGIKDGAQQYTKWFINHDPACTHWMELPDALSNAQQKAG
jgi:hypothetical protein